ncbi:MAG: 16S rRNA processing protein RimM [Flavobacteriales bacterium]|jgi:16S rRNA processing protein RimM|nr:16S rRNA processing protein RimM [Flavobacteriales bacterium]
MQKKDCFLFGTVFKLHGYKGDVNIYNDDDIPFDFSKLDYFLIEQKNELIPYFIDRARPTKPNVVLVNFEDVNSEKEALKILKRKVYLPKEWLPETDETEITEKKLIGLTIIDMNFGNLGKVSLINSQSAQQLIYVEKDGKEFCFPFHEQFVKEIDIKKGEMIVKIPEELIDLN